MNINSPSKYAEKQTENESEKLRKWSSELSLFKQQSTNESEENKRKVKMRPSSTYDALSLEQQLIWANGKITETYTVHHYQLPSGYSAAALAIEELLEDILDYVVDTAERQRREQIVENYLTRAIPAPLVSRDEVQVLGQSLSTASVSLQSNTVRLRAAWKLILVSTAQQLCLSFRRILTRYDYSLQTKLKEQGLEPRSLLTDSSSGILIRLIKDRCRIYIEHRKKRTRSQDKTLEFIELRNQQLQSDNPNLADSANNDDVKEDSKVVDDETEQEFEKALVEYFKDQEQENSIERSESDELLDMISCEAYTELQDVTDRCLSMAVEYLKNATFNLVEEASQDIKQIVYSSTTNL